MVKITRLFTIYEEHMDIVHQIQEQNQWLRNEEFNITRTYTVTTSTGTYTNAIVSCDLLLQVEFIKRGPIIFGINESKCFEMSSIRSFCERVQFFTHLS